MSDAWLFKKWRTEVNGDFLLKATLPLGRVEDEEVVLASRVSVLSNEAPFLFDEEDSPPTVAEPSDVDAPKEGPVVPFILFQRLDFGGSDKHTSILLRSASIQ